MKKGFVYIITNIKKTTLYIGVTSNLIGRIYQHKTGVVNGFSKKYHLTNLVYYEIFEDIQTAISREKQLKNWHKDWKINLINQFNPEWKDLYAFIIGDSEFPDVLPST